MRSIDADELKNAKFLSPQVKVIGGRRCGKLREQIIEAYQKGWNDCIDAIIDNAPTVDNPYQEGHIDGMLQAEKLYARPQGEWIIIDEDHTLSRFKICSNCGKEAEWLDGGSQFLSKFCPNCGADMRKGGAE